MYRKLKREKRKEEMSMEGVNKTQVLKMNGILNLTNPIICYQPSAITTNGMWQKENPLDYSLPLFILQLMIIVVMTQAVVIILKPLRLPRFISQIIGGVLLGPSCFGAIDWVGRNIFPLRSLMVLETMGKIGLLYYLFLMGIEMDVSLVKQTTPKTLIIAAVGLVLPFTLYIGMVMLMIMAVYNAKPSMIIFYQGATISLTAFPVVSRILVELKLFNTELGRKAMSAALIVDLCAWTLITLFMPFADDMNKYVWLTILGSIGVVFFCFLVIRPSIIWIIKRTPEGENFNEFYICLILTGVMICGFITNAIGASSNMGAFIFGLIIPNGPLGTTLLEKLEDFVTTLLLPLALANIGFRVDITSLNNDELFKSTPLVFIVLLLANATKVLSTFIAGLYFDMQMHEALSLGLLMNTKGVIDLIFLHMGFSKRVFDVYFYTINVIFMVVVVSITTPTIDILYQTSRRFISYKHTTIQKAMMNAELKILMCIHTPRNVPVMISLLEASHATKRSPIDVYAIDLVELTGRASAMLIVHNVGKKNTKRNEPNHIQTRSEHVVKAFEDYAENTTNVTVQTFTAISPYPTMHEDICNLAEDKHTTLIIIPFHKQQTVDGSMECINPAFRNLNQNVLANAPCSVGILIDRGFGRSESHTCHHIAVIFIGGSDDREALAYGWRMAEHRCVKLTVMRFITGDSITKSKTQHLQVNETLMVLTDVERERQLDDEYIGDFNLRTLNQESIVYKEKEVNTAEEIVTSIREMDDIHDFYLVGRGQRVESPLMIAGLSGFSESPELGAIGNLLVSEDFATSISVLVIQQYTGKRIIHGGDNKISPVE